MKIRALHGKEEDQEGFKLVFLKEQPEGCITPHCKKHGAMNKMPNGMWRCFTEYGYGKLKEGETTRRFHGRVCNACCMQED